MSRDSRAEAVRAGLVRELERAWEEAGIRGLCGEGRWEFALGRVREMDLASLVDLPNGEEDEPATPS